MSTGESVESEAPEAGGEGPSPVDIDAAKLRLGRRVRELRTLAGQSAGDLARSAEVTPAMVSQVERGTVAPSLATLLRLAASLGVGVNDLFDAAPTKGRIIRKAERRTVDYPDMAVRDQWISADATRNMLVLRSTIEAGADSGKELLRHGSKAECVLVLSGSIEIIVDGESIYLEEGDTVTFSGELPHGFVNHGEVAAELIWVITPASY